MVTPNFPKAYRFRGWPYETLWNLENLKSLKGSGIVESHSNMEQLTRKPFDDFNSFFWAPFIATNRERSPKMVVLYGITPKCPNHSGLGIIVICPDFCVPPCENIEHLLCIGDEILPNYVYIYICIGNVVNHCKDPWTNPYTWWNVISVFERVSFDLKYVSSFWVFISWKLTWHWKIAMFNRKYIFKWWIFHCHVSFRVFMSWKMFGF